VSRRTYEAKLHTYKEQAKATASSCVAGPRCPLHRREGPRIVAVSGGGFEQCYDAQAASASDENSTVLPAQARPGVGQLATLAWSIKRLHQLDVS
jgi:hypothetical protein